MAKIVAVLIVKNEEELLARCLDSVKGVDFCYILDTGSTDKTIEIAKRYTDKVFTDYKWNDSFCEARNHILNKVKEDFKDEDVFIFSIDADEYCVDFSKVQLAIEKAKGSIAIDVALISERERQKHYYPRLFKMCPEIWWEGAVHNHISVKATATSDIEIIYGYSPAHTKDPERSLRILKAEVEKTGNARETFYLGREYWYRSDYKTCAEIMETYVKKAHFLAEKADAFLILAKCYWLMGRGDDARNACMQAITINPHFLEAVKFMSKLAGRGTGDPTFEKNGEWWEKASINSDNSSVLFIANDQK